MNNPINLNYQFDKSDKKNTPIVILHGLLGSSDNWKTITPLLSKEHDIYRLDLRNHGKSPHSDTMTYESMGVDVINFIRKKN